MTRPDAKVFDFADHGSKVDKEIAKQFLSSFMSNAKWRKILSLLHAANPELQLVWKFVGSRNNGVRYGLPVPEAMSETYLTSRFWFGPCYYKEIEWLEIPLMAKPYGKEDLPITHKRQDVESLKSLLDRTGQWEVEVSPNGIRIYGHR